MAYRTAPPPRELQHAIAAGAQVVWRILTVGSCAGFCLRVRLLSRLVRPLPLVCRCLGSATTECPRAPGLGLLVFLLRAICHCNGSVRHRLQRC